jgi:hypothetical protein
LGCISIVKDWELALETGKCVLFACDSFIMVVVA